MRKRYYIFIFDEYRNYYSAKQGSNGSWIVSSSQNPLPIYSLPSNLEEEEIEFATNNQYLSLVRSVSNSFSFVGDGAAILRSLYYQGNGIEQLAYILIMKWNPIVGYHKLEYTGRIDFSKKVDMPKIGTFTVPTVDNTAWGWLSEYDTVQYAVPCNASNPKAIRVLIDNLNLLNTVTFSTLSTPFGSFSSQGNGNGFVFPLALINQSGDSIGIVFNSQSSFFFSGQNIGASTNLQNLLGCVTSLFGCTLTLSGKLNFNIQTNAVNGNGGFWIKLLTVKNGLIVQNIMLYNRYFGYGGNNANFIVNIDQTITLSANETIYIVFEEDENINNDGSTGGLNIVTPVVSNLVFNTETTITPQITYALRPLDLGDAIVQQATNGRYHLYSNFYTTNNKVVACSGDALRGINDAAIYSSFADWFKTYFTLDFTVPVIKNGDIYIESFLDVYNAVNNLGQPNVLLELGECIDLEFDVANDWFCDEVEVGYQKKDYRRPTGTLSFNTTNTFSLDFLNSKNKLDLVAPYSADCYGIVFLIADYQGGSTQDNPDDKSNWLLDITDIQESAQDPIGNFMPINIDDAPLAPYIRYPFTGQIIQYNTGVNIFPVISGVFTPNSTVNIFVDGELNNTVTSDANGYWTCSIINAGSVSSTGLTPFVLDVTTGIHTIDAIAGSSPSEIEPKNTIIITVRNDLGIQPLEIVSHYDGQTVYDNAPLIRGVGNQGDVLTLTINVGTSVQTVKTVTVDESGNWFYQCLPNNYLGTGNTNGVVLDQPSSTISVTNGTQTNTIALSVITKNISIPMVTSFGDMSAYNSNNLGFIETNNLPIINGVAQPGTVIYLYASYIQYQILNANGADPVNRPGVQVTADANGNWSFKCYNVQYNDGIQLDALVTLVPLVNGLSEITASDINYVGQAQQIPISYFYISETAYKLNRPAYSSITGVLDNTVFNTRITPKHILESHYPRFASILQQTQLPLTFQTSYRNANLVTTLNGVTTSERANVTYGELGSPFALMEIAKVTVAVPESFNDIMYAFSQGGLVHCTFNGSDLYLLPIGKMKQASVTADTQVFELLVSSLTSFNTLLSLYKRGITINIMNNTIYHSNANSLHFVKYDFDLPSKYQTPDLYDDLFENRNGFYPQIPNYTQKYNTGDGFQDQLLTYGTPSLYLNVYDAYTGEFKTTINYVPVSPIPIPPPYVVMEAHVNLSTLGVGAFFFVVSNTSGNGGDNYLISEPIIVADSWDRTILIESFNSTNMTDVYFSTGLRTIIRVEGLVKKYQPDISKTVDRDIAGDTNLLYSLSSKKRTIRFGTAYGLPDYLYLKIADALLLDGLMVEGVGYTLGKDEEISPSEDVESHPMFYYDVNLTPSVNQTGVNVQVDNTINQGTVVINMDATAFGYPAGIESIEIDND